MASNYEEQRKNDMMAMKDTQTQNNMMAVCPGCQYGEGYSHWTQCPNRYPTLPGQAVPPGYGQGGIGQGIDLGQLVKAFDSGATRSADDGKNDYEGFLSFPALEEFGDYMTRHRVQPNGALRESDNWQKGIPITSYIKSLVRHALELWGLHRGHISRRLQKEYPAAAGLRNMDFLKRETACACFFNIQGFLHETLKGTGTQPSPVPPQQAKFEEVQKALQAMKDARVAQEKILQFPRYDKDRDNEIPVGVQKTFVR